MRKRITSALISCFFTFVTLGRSAPPATFYVALTGSDTNTGSSTFPWRTIQKAASSVVPSATVIVREGNYDERVATARGGTNEASRITFRAEGTATLRGFSVNHPYVTVDGFDITKHASANRQTGYIEILANGDHFEVKNNVIHDGIYLIRDDLMFKHNPPARDSIASATGGFMAAGFRPGMTVSILLASLLRSTTLTNKDTSKIIESVTDTELTLATNQIVAAEGPVRAMLDASINYGLVVNNGASFGLIRSNVFRNLGYDAGYLGGETNAYEGNIFEQGNGWDNMHWFGVSNVFRGNVIRNAELKTYSNLSPDVFETWGGNIAHDILFEQNFVHNFDGVLGILRDPFATNMYNITFRNNVFVDVSFFYIRIQNVTYLNNTFLRVADHAMDAAQADPHPLEFQSASGQFSSDGAVVRNNIFVGCGDQSKNVSTHGWYGVSGLASFTAENNFVAGAAPNFLSKTGFDEGNVNLNGGDPGFVNINDPLGPDGLPFTDDDGLRLRVDSKLRGSGKGGVDIGAYNVLGPKPKLSIAPVNGKLVRISWPFSTEVFTLQSTPELIDDWTSFPVSSNANGVFFFETNAVLGSSFFDW